MPALLMIVGGGHFETYPLGVEGAVSLGRDPTCDITLDHRRISRRHAVVRSSSATLARHCVVVEDLGSTNGIMVGWQRLAPGESAELPIGQSFQLGPFTVLIATDCTPSRAATAATTIAIVDPTPTGVPSAIARFARSTVSVLIVGETGTGKEVLARTLHELSGRRGPFVGINSAALSETLLESELFGHERGAFTGATQAKPGLLEIAAGGTVFLDEIGDLPASLQAKLLRALETREVYRVGGLKPVTLDVRFLAATHRDLAADVTSGRFRRDLYFRLDGITLQLAPLRKRGASLVGLALAFLAEHAAAAGRQSPRLGVDAVAKLTRYAWPGNVRELRAVMERAFLLSDGDEIGAAAILVGSSVPRLEPESFAEVARRHRGNIAAIARDLGTSRSQVYRLAERFDVVLAAFRN